ncbi:hypothetical protein SAMN02745135_01717 [Caloranaerobacter azorensis DSM 13643]|uniref:Uncharacterized protein n=1 Tax=Caloranaerobacter azorensis DSM 13643 TaxID=1121264 RepID=A0A1M5V3K9_9FIRM|nr:hypothetical protein [Caloranaerobacter azorensis]SHH69750.1 hypothetical protein SAMN02745135_01717 [Caloranaerobacter azorensis DSM 13643]
MIDNNEEYLKKKLEWVKYRIEILDKMEEKLEEMKKLVRYAKDNDLDDEEIKEINIKLNRLKNEIVQMDDKSKIFWMDNQ